ncbi:protein CutA-like isoform X2 [Malaclemys terrapin pileata]|uniref:protein CutA-like isoform X2 n=1 Tax=Malaclemys terrapin pileata TaxID=2991368 RepID=UPI0023A8E95A|nr:protein CutA-like isoform X2 [Malaclemys terrapin pileata]
MILSCQGANPSSNFGLPESGSGCSGPSPCPAGRQVALSRVPAPPGSNRRSFRVHCKHPSQPDPPPPAPAALCAEAEQVEGRAGGTGLGPGLGATCRMKLDWLTQRCQLPAAQGCSRPGCFALLLVITLSLLMYPVLKSLGLQLHSAVTGSYISGTQSIAFVNCPNEQVAKDIARYFWKGEIEEATEILLLVKTRTSRISELSDYIRSMHPFEIPEFISLPIDQGNPFYLKWIEEGVPDD